MSAVTTSIANHQVINEHTTADSIVRTPKRNSKYLIPGSLSLIGTAATVAAFFISPPFAAFLTTHALATTVAAVAGITIPSIVYNHETKTNYGKEIAKLETQAPTNRKKQIAKYIAIALVISGITATCIFFPPAHAITLAAITKLTIGAKATAAWTSAHKLTAATIAIATTIITTQHINHRTKQNLSQKLHSLQKKAIDNTTQRLNLLERHTLGSSADTYKECPEETPLYDKTKGLYRLIHEQQARIEQLQEQLTTLEINTRLAALHS